MERKVRFRLDVDYFSREYEDKACIISTPIYTLEEGMKQYVQACAEYCIDNPEIPARAHLWEYHYGRDGSSNHKTVKKNYVDVR